jgi:peptidyl-prolyl cis-trans isomerase SurA
VPKLIRKTFATIDAKVPPVTSRLLFAAALSFALHAAPAHATVVERIVAVVAERPILLSELRARARPELLALEGSPSARDANLRAAEEQEVLKSTLERMIEDELIALAADRIGKALVTSEDVDNAFKQLAEQNNVTVRALFADARRKGKSEQEYRDEVRRQLLEGQMLQAFVQPRVRVSEQDARAIYEKGKRETLEDSVGLRTLILAVRPTDDPAAREKHAQGLYERAKGGEDFCKLVAEHSDDVNGRAQCGLRVVPASQLPPGIRERVAHMKGNDISEVIKLRTPNGDVLSIFQLSGDKSMAPFEKLRDEMMSRARFEAIVRQRKVWLDEVRRTVVVEPRL